MNYKKLGRTGLTVSSICLGTLTLGKQVSETDSINLIKSALAAGINFVDTASVYGDYKCEEIIGKAVKGARRSVILATKVGSKRGLGMSEAGALSRKHIMESVEDSLRRMQTDYIDLYYTHRPDHETPLEETLRTLDDLVHQGKVRYLGCSNYWAWMLCKALWVSDCHDLEHFVCIQPPYNLLTRDIEIELLPLCASEGIGVCVYNPLAGELLTGRHTFGKQPAEGRLTQEEEGPMYLERYWSERNFEAVDRLKQVANKNGRTLAQFSLAWILNNPTITSVLTGVTSIQQLEENLVATGITLSEEELQACDAVWQQMFRPPRFPYWK